MKRILLIGTSHLYQTWDGRAENKATAQFRDLLTKLSTHYNVAAIAEEMNREALKKHSASKSVPEIVATQLGIGHQFSDPTRTVRQELGIRQENDIRAYGFIRQLAEAEIQSQLKESHAIRENYWMNQLKQLNLWPVIFVCGADHVNAFSQLLRRNEYEVSVLSPDWEPT